MKIKFNPPRMASTATGGKEQKTMTRIYQFNWQGKVALEYDLTAPEGVPRARLFALDGDRVISPLNGRYCPVCAGLRFTGEPLFVLPGETLVAVIKREWRRSRSRLENM